ncbi:hypothetical protein EDD18DRAFT_1116506 [Armillaria luteobubalina]|uniref:Uncharacterized protein n=1 Tax=Armillaria luteobubalina TaxID=153913 RepID=A0AA39NZ05_9AGAR|nr:hypothetical protein EDD18DRAFT_1116506 [Armillaria luteobubalina]
MIQSYLSHLITQHLPTSVVSAAAFKAGYHHAATALCSSWILPITIKAGPDNADLLADLVELFPEHARPDQMARIIERSDKVGEVSNQIKSKFYCVLDGKTAFGKVRMIFVTDNFKEVESFLNNGNTWKRETSLHKGLLYMLQNFQGAEPYVPITPPEPNITLQAHTDGSPPSLKLRILVSQPQHLRLHQLLNPCLTSPDQRLPHCRMCGKRMKGRNKIACICQWCCRPKALHNGQVCQPQNQPLVSAQSAPKGKGQGTFQMPESQSCFYLQTQSSSKGKGRERSQTPDLDSEVDLELEEHISRLEEQLNSLGL